VTGPFKIGTLARLTGLSPAVLRAWERRYALLEPMRGPGGQRLYTDDDYRVLTRIRALIESGRSIGEVARIGRDRLLAGVEAPEASDQAAAESARGQAGRLQDRLVRAALALDSREVSGTLDDAFAMLPAERVVADVIEPVAEAVGRLWESGRCSVASEHLISDQFLHRIHRLLDAAQPSDEAAPHVVAACFPDEQHQLGLAILAWQLARRGLRVTYLGVGLPLDDLMQACRAAHPWAMVLSVTRGSVFDVHHGALVERLSDELAGLPVFIGGQGVSGRSDHLTTDGQVACVGDLSLPAVVDRVVGAARRDRSRTPVAAARRQRS